MDESIKILLVDDDPIDAKSFEAVLSKTPFNCQFTHIDNIKGGIVAINNESFDVVFVDYHMPNGNPYDILNHVASHDIKTPVVVITAFADPQTAVDLVKSGATDYIPKSLLNEDGLAQCIRSSIRVKELKEKKSKTEQRLKNVEGRLTAIISSTPIILFVTDKDGYFQLGLGKFWGAFSPQNENVIGRNIEDVFSTYPKFLKAFEAAKKGRIQVFKITINQIIFEITLTPKFSKSNELEELLGLALDVTNHEEGKKKLEEAKQIAEKASQLKQEFIANMSHEIRTPMNAITGFADLLVESELNTLQADYVNSIKTSGENLLLLVNDILDFSKIESGKIEMVVEPFELSEVIQSVAKVLKIRAKERGNELQISYNTEYKFFKGDAARIYQILINIVNNAIKFTENGTIKVSVEVVKEGFSKADVLITVKDSGVGIPEEKLKDIFESFVQVDGGVARKVGGTGLGLAIVRKLVKLMRGEIDVKSKVNEGSEFAIKIPLDFSDSTAVHEKYDELDWKAALKGKRILLVEDNEMNQKLVIMYLKRFDLLIDLAENGEQAVKAVKANEYDIVLMDVQMPIMDGIEATKIIRSLPKEKNKVPIVAMTAHAFKLEIEKCFDAGMNAHVSKPIEKDNFFNVISSLVSVKLPIKEGSLNEVVGKNGVPVDLSYLREMSGGNTVFIKEMLDIFKKDSPDLISDMRQHYNRRDWQKLRKTAHKYRSPAVMMGMKGVADLAGEVEAFDFENEEVNKIENMLNEIQSVSELAVEYIESNFYGE